MFEHLDTNNDGNIDLAEFTRFCLEVGCLAAHLALPEQLP